MLVVKSDQLVALLFFIVAYSATPTSSSFYSDAYAGPHLNAWTNGAMRSMDRPRLTAVGPLLMPAAARTVEVNFDPKRGPSANVLVQKFGAWERESNSNHPDLLRMSSQFGHVGSSAAEASPDNHPAIESLYPATDDAALKHLPGPGRPLAPYSKFLVPPTLVRYMALGSAVNNKPNNKPPLMRKASTQPDSAIKKPSARFALVREICRLAKAINSESLGQRKELPRLERICNKGTANNIRLLTANSADVVHAGDEPSAVEQPDGYGLNGLKGVLGKLLAPPSIARNARQRPTSLAETENSR